MGSDEIAIIDYLKQFPKNWSTTTEISKRAAGRRRYAQERDWARPVLRRLEADGHLESNEYGHYKLRDELIAKYTSASRKMDREGRCRSAITSHVINMPSADDEKPFSTLIREALSTHYAGDTGLCNRSDQPPGA
jgi:hypothetical protein